MADQVRGILREVLDGPGLSEDAKARLRRLMLENHSRPELALIEHLRLVRDEAGPEEELMAG